MSDVPWFSSLFLSPEFSPFSFVPLSVGGCPSLHLFCVFLPLDRLGLFCCFSLACPLTFYRIPPWSLLRVPSFFRGFSFLCLSLPHPCVSPMHGPFGFHSYGLGCGPFRCVLLFSCASSPYCLFRPWALPSLLRSWFVYPRSPSSLFQSTLRFLSISWGFFMRFLVSSLLREGISSSLAVRVVTGSS